MTAPLSRGKSPRLRGLLMALLLSACAGHSDKTQAIRSALDAGQPSEALKHVNEALDVSTEKELPETTGGDKALLLLDRAMILQQLERYQLSSRDLEIADKQVDMLDLSRSAVHDIGKYLFSDDVGPYKAPPYEKLLVNTQNIVNYLARGDLNGARIEARRLAVMQKYLSQHEDPTRGLLGPGSYLAGFAFEKSGRAEEALRYYDEALAYGSYASLAQPVSALLTRAGYTSPRLRKVAAEAATSPAAEEDAEILVIVNFGRVPAKVAQRVPIGLALTYASGALSPEDHQRANYLAAQGLVTWVNYPELGRPRGTYDVPRIFVDRRAESVEGVAAIDSEARKAWDEAKGTVIASAITRMLSRVVAGEAVRQTTKDGVLGAILSLGVQATLSATDTPDTRSWQTLPARIAFGRYRVKPGVHDVRVVSRGISKRRRVELAAGGWAVVAHTVLF